MTDAVDAAVLAALEALADTEGCVWASRAEVATRCGVGTDAVKNAQIRLLDAGRIDVHVHGDRKIPRVVRSEPASQTFEWGGDLQSAKRWSLELAACKDRKLTPTMKMVGWGLREHAHIRDGTVYMSSAGLAKRLGRNPDNVGKDRAALQRAGWFLDTGERRSHPAGGNAMKVWKLSVPPCECGAHGIIS